MTFRSASEALRARRKLVGGGRRRRSNDRPRQHAAHGAPGSAGPRRHGSGRAKPRDTPRPAGYGERHHRCEPSGVLAELEAASVWILASRRKATTITFIRERLISTNFLSARNCAMAISLSDARVEAETETETGRELPQGAQDAARWRSRTSRISQNRPPTFSSK